MSIELLADGQQIRESLCWLALVPGEAVCVTDQPLGRQPLRSAHHLLSALLGPLPVGSLEE